MSKRSLKHAAFAASLVAAATLTPAAFAQTNFTDSTGDILATSSIMDITSVEVSNNAFDLIFKITLAGDPVATDWGKYMIAFDTKPGGDTLGNGWNRPIAWSQGQGGMDYWVGTWVNGPAGQLWEVQHLLEHHQFAWRFQDHQFRHRGCSLPEHGPRRR